MTSLKINLYLYLFTKSTGPFAFRENLNHIAMKKSGNSQMIKGAEKRESRCGWPCCQFCGLLGFFGK